MSNYISRDRDKHEFDFNPHPYHPHRHWGRLERPVHHHGPGALRQISVKDIHVMGELCHIEKNGESNPGDSYLLFDRASLESARKRRTKAIIRSIIPQVNYQSLSEDIYCSDHHLTGTTRNESERWSRDTSATFSGFFIILASSINATYHFAHADSTLEFGSQMSGFLFYLIITLAIVSAINALSFQMKNRNTLRNQGIYISDYYVVHGIDSTDIEEIVQFHPDSESLFWESLYEYAKNGTESAGRLVDRILGDVERTREEYRRHVSTDDGMENEVREAIWRDRYEAYLHVSESYRKLMGPENNNELES